MSATLNSRLEWFDSWVDFLVNEGFAERRNVYDDDGKLVSDIYISAANMRPIINLDETQIPRSRAIPRLGRICMWRSVC